MTQTAPPSPDTGAAARPCHVLGTDHGILLTADQTGGSCSAFRITVPAGWGNPRHVHWFEDEVFYVLEGQLDITIGDRTTTVPAGGAAFGPRRVPHQFSNPGPTTAMLLVVATPGGLERFFQACEAAYPPGAEIDPQGVASLVERHGMSMA